MKATKWIIAGGAIVLGLIGFQATASAATVTQLIGGGGSIFISDEDGETVIDRNSNGLIDVGDSISGVLTFDQFQKNVNPEVPLLHSAGNSELGGVFQIMVTSKTPSIAFPGQFNYTFGVDPAFAAAHGANAMVALFEDPVGGTDANINNAGSQSASSATVTDGSLFLLLGITGAGNGWTGRGSDNPASVSNPSDRLGISTFALSRVSTSGIAGTMQFQTMANPAGAGEFVGTSQIGGAFSGSPWPLSSESDAEFTAIPTPSALFGGLLLMGGLLCRKARLA